MPQNLLFSTLVKLLLPALGIVLMLVVARRRRLSFADDIGLARPVPAMAVLFALLWLVLIAVEEYFTGSNEATQAKTWPDYPLVIVVLRALAIGVVGPIAEELAIRGLVMGMLRRTRLGSYGAIVVSAAAWSAMHIQYAPLLLLLLIFIDGVMLGLARHFSRSLYVPMLMHIIGNLYSIHQSLAR
jgi:membrane protease YdiL (CAAX protease family)